MHVYSRNHCCVWTFCCFDFNTHFSLLKFISKKFSQPIQPAEVLFLYAQVFVIEVPLQWLIGSYLRVFSLDFSDMHLDDDYDRKMVVLFTIDK